MKNPMPVYASATRLQPGKQAGFTLIEMMIAITIGLGILAGLVGVLATSSSNSRSNDRTSELMTNGRYALNSMKQELREAGFLGYTYNKPDSLAAIAVTGCEDGATAAAFISNVRQGVWGVDDTDPNPNPFSGSCIPVASYSAGNDILVVRRLDPIPAPPDAAKPNEVYFQSSYGVGQVFQGVVPAAVTGTPLATFKLKVYVYYISPFTVSATETPLVPALFRMSLDSSGAMVRELVASGIERMQVQYGANTPTTQYQNKLAGASSDPSAITGWEDVNSVRIWLLARNTIAEPGYTNTTTYSMGNAPDYMPADNFRRQLFTTVVQLRNWKAP